MPDYMQIANTTLAQLGGRRFMVMTGASNPSGSAEGLSLKLPRNASKAQYLVIKLEADDTYTMRFIRIRKFEAETVKECAGVYCDNLRNIFADVTGLATSL